VILAAAALVGTRVLEMFGMSLDTFSVAGGFVLAWMGFSMLEGARPWSQIAPRRHRRSHQNACQVSGKRKAAA